MQNKQTYYRLVSLWVVCEALLGGIIHGLKLPVSGLIVGGSAVICICMIAYYYPVRGAIIKATIIVAIFKMMLSPQSPFPAYIAVFFQGLVAEAIFVNKRTFRLNCILLGVIALFESGIQRILVMTIVFGMDIWKAIDIFISGITNDKAPARYSYYIAISYVSMHIVIGFFIGWFAGKIPGKIKSEGDFELIDLTSGAKNLNNGFHKSKKRKIIFQVIWIMLSLLFLHALFYPQHAFIPSNIILKLLLRSILIILTWMIVINPLLIKFLHRWLEKKKTSSQNDIQQIVLLLPSTQYLVKKSWSLSSKKRGLSRLSSFFKIVFYNSLRNE